ATEVTRTPAEVASAASVAPPAEPEPSLSFASFWDFARAVNRSAPAALAIAGHGADSEIPMDGRELRKLLGTFWFRSVFPRLSPAWHERMLDVLVENVSIPDHVIKTGRRSVRVSELTNEQRRQLLNGTSLPDAVRLDLQLLVMVATLWGEQVLERFALTRGPDVPD